MIDPEYSLVIEATEEPDFFGFYSPDIKGFSGIGNSIEDCIYKAKWAMKDHLQNMSDLGLPLPKATSIPKIIIQNEEELIPA